MGLGTDGTGPRRPWWPLRSASATHARRLILIGAVVTLAGLALPSTGFGLEATTPGHLYSFGRNEAGELGVTANLGTNTANPTPALVTLPEGSGYVTQVAAGGFHTLVVTSLGQLYSFGSNGLGQLGTIAGSGTFTPDPTPEAVALPGATGTVVQAAGGEAFSVALTSTGQLYGFGSDGSGELARTPPANLSEPNPTPTLITVPGVTFAHIATGGEHVLAISSTGVLYAFGENRYGQLGSSAASPDPTPEAVTLPGASGPVTQVAGGIAFSLALTSTGQLYSFGENAYGQLGNTTHLETFKANPTPALVSLPGATGAVTQIAAGEFVSLASTATGQLYAFGINQCGQLGLETDSGTEKSNPTPTLVTLPGASGGVRELSAGAFQGLVLTGAGQLFAFGCNGYGQLGSTINNGNILTPNPTPALVAPPEGDTIESIGIGGEATASFLIVNGPAVREAEREKAAREPQAKAKAEANPPIDSGGLVPKTPGPSPGAGPPVPLPLTITHTSFTEQTFRVANEATAISAKQAPLGTSIRLTLSTAAKLQIAITSSATGLRHGSECVAPTARLEKAHAKHCARRVTDGTFTRANEHAGADSVAFSGRIGRRVLKPGAYEAVLSAANAEAKAKAVTLPFVVAPPTK
jgi:alpha-tubulin suppressor-like RCC1 family protein